MLLQGRNVLIAICIEEMIVEGVKDSAAAGKRLRWDSLRSSGGGGQPMGRGRKIQVLISVAVSATGLRLVSRQKPEVPRQFQEKFPKPWSQLFLLSSKRKPLAGVY